MTHKDIHIQNTEKQKSKLERTQNTISLKGNTVKITQLLLCNAVEVIYI